MSGIEKPVYPRLSYEKKRSTRVTLDEIQKIRELTNQGLTLVQISQKLGISRSTLYYHVDEKTKARIQRKNSIYKHKLFQNNPAYRIKQNEISKRIQKERYRIDPDYRKYKSLKSKAYYQKHRSEILTRKRLEYAGNPTPKTRPVPSKKLVDSTMDAIHRIAQK